MILCWAIKPLYCSTTISNAASTGAGNGAGDLLRESGILAASVDLLREPEILAASVDLLREILAANGDLVRERFLCIKRPL